MPTVGEVVAKYIELRDRKAAIAERHKEELAPISTAMEQIEMWMLNKMNEDGVENYRTEFGTPYKAITTSVKVEEPELFRRAVFAPLINALAEQGIPQHIAENIVLYQPLWDMVDFRAGKKGIMARVDETGQLPPGIKMDSFTTVNIRRD